MKIVQIAFAAMLCAVSVSAAAQTSRYDELKQTTDTILALMEAENAKSDLCKSYVGQVVTLTSFDALTRNLPDVSEKGEYETTPQYEARMASASSWKAADPSVLPIPIDRDYVEYNADLGVMIVKATAFDTERSGNGARASYGVSTTKLVRSYMSMTRAGIQFRASQYERHTNALHLTNSRFFTQTSLLEKPVMLLEVYPVSTNGTDLRL